MNPHEPSIPRMTASPRTYAEPSWDFAAWFAAIGFVVGGSVVFYLGFRQAFPPPPPPGTGDCGLAGLGGLFTMLVMAPVAAIASSAVAGGIGAVVDYVRSRSAP